MRTSSKAPVWARSPCRNFDRCRQPPIPELRPIQPAVAVRASEAAVPEPAPGDSSPGATPQVQPDQVPQSTGQVQVLPRLKERDPFKVLGIPADADFEEVIQARNYLIQEYQEHERSREHVEAAFERIVSQSFQERQKKGFRPARLRSGKAPPPPPPPPTVFSRLKSLLDPSVTLASAARDTLMFTALALWSGFTVPVNTAATLVAFGYATFRTTMARKIRNPDGPYFGDSPVFGAVLKVVLLFVATNCIAGGVSAVVPWPSFGIEPEQANAFMVLALLGPLNVALR